jgi:hypothetical protein
VLRLTWDTRYFANRKLSKGDGVADINKYLEDPFVCRNLRLKVDPTNIIARFN